MDVQQRTPLDFKSLADKGKANWWLFLMTIILAFLVQIIATIAVYVALIFNGFTPNKLTSALQDPTQPLYFFPTIGLSFASLLIGFIIGGRLLHKKSFSDYTGRWKWHQFTMGLGLWLAVLGVDAYIGYLISPSGFQPNMSPIVPEIVGVIIASLGVQTFAEEFIFRGYITQALLRIFHRPIPTAIVSGLIFGAFHIPNGWVQAGSATILGIGLALIAIKTGNLAFGYGIHLINNLFGALIVVSGRDVFKGAPGLLIQNTPNLDGLDMGVVTLALGLILFVLFRQDHRHPKNA